MDSPDGTGDAPWPRTKLSVVVLTYNKSWILGRFFESLARQTRPPDQVVVVDDASTDGTPELLRRRHWQWPVVRMPRHRGPSHAKNAGFRATQGDLVAFLEGDIVMRPYMLEAMERALRETPGASVAYGHHERGKGDVCQSFPWSIDRLVQGNFLPSAALIRRADMPNPPFDESLRRCEDWDLWLTMMENGKKGVLVDDVLFSARSVSGESAQSRAAVERKHSAPAGTAPPAPAAKPAVARAPARPRAGPTAAVSVKAAKVTCIFTSYNRPRLVRHALKSVADQTHRNYELLVYDDSTLLDIEAVVSEFRFPDVRVFHSKVDRKRRGSECRLGINCNAGLAEARGDLVCFLCDDDYYFPTWFESAVKWFADPNNAGKNVGFGRLIYSSSMSMDFPTAGKGLFYQSAVYDPGCRLDHNQVMHRRMEDPVRWPMDFASSSTPDAAYFSGIARRGNLFHPIDALAVVKRIHTKNYQKTMRVFGTAEGETVRE